ncbi:MAG TPA: DmsE family decaheme c-type cytochrome [Rhodocyclaceae bacterium]
MTFFKKMLMVCALAGSLGWAGGVAAADKLPDSNLGAAPATAQARLDKDRVCTRCHDESEPTPLLSLYQTKHGVRGDARAPNCQSCHGESEKHLHGDPKVKGRAAPDIVFKKGTYEPSDEKVRAAQCLNCHKGTARTRWDGGAHDANGLACNNCHTIHRPADPVLSKKTQTQVCFTCHKEQRADSLKISTHPIDAGKVVCSDCHNPHGSTAPKLLKRNTVNETCWTCHAEKRGPFLWEHQPVTEDCTNCHTPHGSNISPLLKNRPPMLCDDCHDGPHNSQAPYGKGMGGIQGGQTFSATLNAANNPNSNASGRACLNCHVMIHGTNSPAGALLHR